MFDNSIYVFPLGRGRRLDAPRHTVGRRAVEGASPYEESINYRR